MKAEAKTKVKSKSNQNQNQIKLNQIKSKEIADLSDQLYTFFWLPLTFDGITRTHNKANFSQIISISSITA